jgi:hypothetical protein
LVNDANYLIEKKNTMFLIFNHDLTDTQREDAATSLGVRRFVALPPDLQHLWSRIPPGIERLVDYLRPVTRWLSREAKAGDFVLIQGDFGASFILVNIAFELGLIPVYSTTQRLARELRNRDGSVETTHLVRHVAFRKYEAVSARLR